MLGCPFLIAICIIKPSVYEVCLGRLCRDSCTRSAVPCFILFFVNLFGTHARAQGRSRKNSTKSAVPSLIFIVCLAFMRAYPKRLRKKQAVLVARYLVFILFLEQKTVAPKAWYPVYFIFCLAFGMCVPKFARKQSYQRHGTLFIQLIFGLTFICARPSQFARKQSYQRHGTLFILFIFAGFRHVRVPKFAQKNVYTRGIAVPWLYWRSAQHIPHVP